MFGVSPWRGYQRNTACERFEHANGWYAGQCFDIWPARNVHGDLMLSENLRHEVVRKPPAIFNACGTKCGTCIFRISNPVDRSLESERSHGFNQKLMQLGGPFVITPIPHPHHIAGDFLSERFENAHISRFVPGPRATGPTLVEVR